MWLLILACSTSQQRSCCDTDIQSRATSPRPFDSATETESDSLSRAAFVECSPCIDENPAKRRYGIAISDVNNDGDFEAIVTGYGSANQVLDWQDGMLVDITPAVLKDAQRKAIGVAACDVDGDGAEEIYFLNVDQFGGLGTVTDRLFDYSGGSWRDLFELEHNRALVNQFSGRSVACLDRNAVGSYGVFVANYGGPMRLFEVDGDVLSEVGHEAGVAYTTGGRALLALPVFDGGMHLFAGNERGPNFFFKNAGDGTFVEQAEELGIMDAEETVRGATTLDIDADGDLDLVYGNWEGPHRMWAWNGTSFDDVTPNEVQTPSRIRTVIAADFDNDGNEELFFNNIGEPNRLFRQNENGEWVSTEIGDALESDGLGTGAAVFDADGDGRLELLVAHGESGAQPMSLYRWASNGNNYLRVFPKTKHGAPARGAIVEVKTANKTHMRSIDAGSGYLCQMEPVAHIGLGRLTTVERITVTWPDGVQAVLENVPANQLLVVEYADAHNQEQ